jgi:hypothetical protein
LTGAFRVIDSAISTAEDCLAALCGFPRCANGSNRSPGQQGTTLYPPRLSHPVRSTTAPWHASSSPTARSSHVGARNRVVVLRCHLLWGHELDVLGQHTSQSPHKRVDPHNYSEALTSIHSSPWRYVSPVTQTNPPDRSLFSPRKPPFTIQRTALQPYAAPSLHQWHRSIPKPREQPLPSQTVPPPAEHCCFGSRGCVFWFATHPKVSTSRVNPHNHSGELTNKHSPPW